MPRCKKKRRICFLPECRVFSPRGGNGGRMEIALDELEALRLADFEGLEQDAAAKLMGISRGTFQRLVYEARRKTAGALVNGWGLTIGGGDYEISGRCRARRPCCSICKAENAPCSAENGLPSKNLLKNPNRKGHPMIIAVTTEGDSVFQHFGQCASFTIAEIENGKVKSKKLVRLDNGGHGMNAAFLKASNAEILICGGIGPGALEALAENGIKVLAGVEGSVGAALEAFLKGSLKASGSATCSHHDHGEGHAGHHGDGSSCNCHSH